MPLVLPNVLPPFLVKQIGATTLFIMPYQPHKNAPLHPYYALFHGCQGRGREFESRFPLQTPRIAARRFCLSAGWFAPCPLYMSRLYRKTSAERRFHVQVSRIWPIIDPIPRDLCRKPRPEMHFGAQARLVHRIFYLAGQIHLEETGIALIPGVDQYEVIIIYPSIRDTGG